MLKISVQSKTTKEIKLMLEKKDSGRKGQKKLKKQKAMI